MLRILSSKVLFFVLLGWLEQNLIENSACDAVHWIKPCPISCGYNGGFLWIFLGEVLSTKNSSTNHITTSIEISTSSKTMSSTSRLPRHCFNITFHIILLIGYYGDPTLGSAIPCRECMCPGGEGSGYQHADTCSLDPRTKEMICDCPPQYAGKIILCCL